MFSNISILKVSARISVHDRHEKWDKKKKFKRMVHTERTTLSQKHVDTWECSLEQILDGLFFVKGESFLKEGKKRLLARGADFIRTLNL